MKYFQLFIGVTCFICLLILYFQLVTYGSYILPFFATYIEIAWFTIALIILAFCSGMFITLSVKGFMSGSNTIDDDFDL